MMKRKVIIFFTIIAFLPSISYPHPGRTDFQGGHSNRKTGEYHYHNKKHPKAPNAILTPFNAVVVGISDGDTITVLTSNRKEVRIRLANIDTPERRQPFGKKAKQTLSDFIYKTDVEIRPQAIDRYGRTVAVVLRAGLDVSAYMLVKGMAWVYTKYNKDPSLPAIEKSARDSKKGLWSEPNPTPPWEWRKHNRRV